MVPSCFGTPLRSSVPASHGHRHACKPNPRRPPLNAASGSKSGRRTFHVFGVSAADWRWAIKQRPLLAAGNLLSCQLGNKRVGISSRPLRHLAGSRLVFWVYLLLACEDALHGQHRKKRTSRSFIQNALLVCPQTLLSLSDLRSRGGIVAVSVSGSSRQP